MISLQQILRSFLCCLAFFGVGHSASADHPLTLADAGVTDYAILLPENPSPVQTTTAKELAANLKEISGAEFPIETETAESADPAKRQLVIGPSATSRALLAGSVDEDVLAYDTIVIKQVGNSIVFSGHPVRGPLYAVNTFLEDELGCRWWTSDESFIPKREKVVADDFDRVYTPKLINREPYFVGIFGEKNFPFAVHMKCNGSSEKIPEEYGGYQSHLYFAHSFNQIIPMFEFEEHPDWFPEINGVRQIGVPQWWGTIPEQYKELFSRLKPEQISSGGTQLCLTNEELFQEMLRRVLADIEKHPETSIVSISQNDWYGYCECEKCKAITDEEESLMGPYIRFVNRMAEEIEKVYPDVYVDTLAYQFTRKPPKLTRARDNVVIRLCSIECSFIQPLAEGEQNTAFREDIEGWARMADHLFVWDYTSDFANYLLPFPNWRVLADNINFFVNNHAIGVFELGDYHNPSGDFLELRAWVVAKLLWDPSLDQRELMKEFIAGYYAPELVPIYLDYFDLLSDSYEACGERLEAQKSSAGDWISLKAILKASELMDRAQIIAEELETADPEKYGGLLFKVRRERIPLDLVWLRDYPRYRLEARIAGIDSLPTLAEMKALAEDFNARLDASHITHHQEWSTQETFDAFKKGFVNKYDKLLNLKKASVPDMCRDLPDNRWIELQTINLNLLEPGELTFIEKDPEASDGETVRIPTVRFEGAINYDLKLLEGVPAENTAPRRFYAFVRAESADGKDVSEGPLFKMGIHNKEENRCETEIKTVSTADLNGSGYTAVDLGEIPPVPHLGFWIAPVERTDSPVNIYIDRFVITF